MATAFDDLIKRGFGWVLSVEIEGIPYVLAERVPVRADTGAAVSLPSRYLSASGSLLIEDGQKIGIEADRAGGVGRGKAWEMVLSWAGLEADGLLGELFKTPTLRGNLTAAVD